MRADGLAQAARATTSMVWPLAWIMVRSSVMIATWPFQKTRSPRRKPDRSSPGSIGSPSVAACMSESRSTSRPAMRMDSCTRPEQSMPKRGRAAPEIGRVEKRLGDRDIVAGRTRRRDADGRRSSPRRSTAAHSACRASRRSRRSSTSEPSDSAERRKPQIGTGIDEGAQRADTIWVGASRPRAEQAARRRSRHSRRARPGPRPSPRPRRRR